jgi:pimeloyl-ACP methyl ester carboxylesterase
MKQLQIPQGTIRYRDHGSGEPVLLVHGLLADGELWRDVAPILAADFRVIVPDWPLGSHVVPLKAGVDLSPPGLAAIIAAFASELGLENATVVGNDTGGAICQLVAVNHPESLGRLVLTPCDAYENFLPPAFRPLQALARIPGALAAMLQAMRLPVLRRQPLAFGWLSKRADDALTESWLRPARSSRAIRHELAKILAGISNRYTLQAAERFAEFEKPVLIAWAPEDRFFKLTYGERLAQAFPDAHLELIEDSYSFVPLDQPRRTAELIAAFAREPVAGALAGGARRSAG